MKVEEVRSQFRIPAALYAWRKESRTCEQRLTTEIQTR